MRRSVIAIDRPEIVEHLKPISFMSSSRSIVARTAESRVGVVDDAAAALLAEACSCRTACPRQDLAEHHAADGRDDDGGCSGDIGSGAAFSLVDDLAEAEAQTDDDRSCRSICLWS